MGEAAQVVARAAGKIPRPYVDEPQLSSPNRLAKALFDRVGAAVALVVAGPLLLVLALAVKATSDGPALYRQERVGLDGRRFRMWKIRTMHEDADQHRAQLAEQLGGPPLFKMVDDPRVTRIGRVLRRWSLDELPQLWNVLKGEMSLVGPRPGMPDEVDRHHDELMRRRMLVKPGLTGLWQVSGRSNLPWEECVRLDLHYVDNWSLFLDVQILLRTTAAVLRREGAY
jgi:exopolysaccharide biosynthesis polyprenyl glycosylphosphotransferase